MPNLTIPNTFSNSTVADATAVNANFTAVATLLNSTGLDSSGLASNSVTTTKILDANVTAAKLASDSVTTAKIADGAVTQAKRAALGQILSTSSGSTNTNGAITPVVFASLTIVTTGRPVMIMLQPDGTTNSSFLGLLPNSGTPTSMTAVGEITRDGVAIAKCTLSVGGAASASLQVSEPTNISFIDTGATAASHTYAIQFTASASTTNCYVYFAKLVAFEL